MNESAPVSSAIMPTLTDACVMADTSHELYARHGARVGLKRCRRVYDLGEFGLWARVREILAKGDLPDQRRCKQLRIGHCIRCGLAPGDRRWLRSSSRRSAMVSKP